MNTDRPEGNTELQKHVLPSVKQEKQRRSRGEAEEKQRRSRGEAEEKQDRHKIK